MKDAERLRIVFMGTPGFAVASLRALSEAGYDIAAVVTAPDKPAGRGLGILTSPVKMEAERLGCMVLQPDNLKNESFINHLQRLQADLFAVVAFRMLPAIVWKIPPLGTINLHASLLPKYRGAAPIHRAIMNGEKVTGVTTFFINDRMDAGDILFREETLIGEEETAGSLHDRLMVTGAALLGKTVSAIAAGEAKTVKQNVAAEEVPLPEAPRIFRDDCRINWDEHVDAIYNFIRGLSPWPGAWTRLSCSNRICDMRIFSADKVAADHTYASGTIVCDRSQLRIAVRGGYIRITSLQAEGKKRLCTEDFLRGFDLSGCIVN